MMKKTDLKAYLVFILITEAVGILAGLLIREGTQIFGATAIQPPLSPPAFLFPIVWTVLYALMGIGGARVWLSPDTDERSRGLKIFFVQLVLNFFWSLIFFNAQSYGFALLWLLVLWAFVLWMILSFYRTDSVAAWLQIPYLLWITFAIYLNAGVWWLNR